MPRILHALAVIVTAATALVSPALGQGAPPPNTAAETRAMKLATLYNTGMMFFEGGLATGDKEKFKTAIEKLEEFLGMLTPDEKRKPTVSICFLAIAECWYRLGGEENVTKAIGYWTQFLQTWPEDPRVLEVKMAIAQAYMGMKKWETAIGWWAQVETAVGKKNNPIREHALSGQAFCYQKLKKPEEEVKVLERLVYDPEFNTPVSAEGAVRLMSLYAIQHDPANKESMKFADKAIELLLKLQKKTYLVENFIALNGIAIRLGDELLEVNAFTKALEAYWAVRPRDVVVRMQKERIAAMELRMEQGIKAAGKEPKALAAAQRLNEDYIKPRIEEAKGLLAKFEALPDFMPALYFRMARCFADMNKKWEAIVVFNQILTDYPTASVREIVIFSRLALYCDLGIAERAYTLCNEYLKEYPAGPHAGEVGYLRGITAMRKKDWITAEQYFEAAIKILASLPEDQKKLYWTESRYQLANSRFLQNKFELAMADFSSFVAEFGQLAGGRGAFIEDAEYQLALCHLFTGHYMKDPDKGGEDGAIERLEAYLKKWSGQSSYGSDAKYRLAVCRFAAYENEQAVKDCEEWLATYGKVKGEILHPEVYSLLGDARAALKQHHEAAEAYVEGYKRAMTDEVLNYALFEAGKMYQKAGEWEAIEKLYTEFVQKKPAHPAAVTCVYWMGKAKAKLGRMDEAKKITTEALQKHIGDPKREGVEMMLGQLAEWSRRRPPTTELATPDAPLPKWDPQAELDRILKPLAEKANPTAQARLMYANAEMQRILRAPDKRAAIIAEISEKIKTEDLSPHLLMECGDSLMARGQVDRAQALYRMLKENFRKSERVDAGWVGLADVNFSRKDYKTAMELYTYAIDRLGAPWKLKEALIGQARCHLEFGDADKANSASLSATAHFTKARKTFEEVASVREWRGETTAMALYYIAESYFRMGKFKEATTAFERVTVSQGKYPVWVARSYLRASDGYYRQGKDDLAKERLRDLIVPKDERSAERLKNLPEVEEARKKLDSLGGSV